MRSWGRSPHDGICALVRDQRELALSPTCLDTAARKPKSPHQNPTTLAPISDFPASRAVRNKHLLFKPPSLWYFVRAVQADEDKVSALPITHHLVMSFIAPCLLEWSSVKGFTVFPIRLTSIRARVLPALFLPVCPASRPVSDTQEVLLKCVWKEGIKEGSCPTSLNLPLGTSSLLAFLS